uniref:Late embryogenesis abundant protein LEA-2 subgroup domain-containing protein n=1 Tax=Solanum lycopersicum TaxID=4081 RepID=A0A3Q7HWE8_SOLLC
MATDQKYPLAPSNIMPRSDAEFATTNFQSNNQRRKKKLRNIFLLTIFLTGIILLFSFTFLRIKSPKIRIENIRITNDGDGMINFSAQVFLRNRNFWRYDYDSTLGTINTAEGTTIGRFVIPDGEARRRSTQKVYVIANINLPSRINNTSGILPVISEAKMRGKLKVFRVFRWKKTVDLSCTMSINLTISAIQDLDCQ